MEKDSYSPPKPSNYLPVRQFSNRGRSLSPDRYPKEQVPSPFTDASSKSVFKLTPSLAKTDSVLVEYEHKPKHNRPPRVLIRRRTMDSILLPPPAHSSCSVQRPPAELSCQSYSQLPISCSTSPKVQNTCNVPNRHLLSSTGEKTRPALPRMRLVRSPSPINQFESTLDGQYLTVAQPTHSDCVQTAETSTSIPLLNYDPNGAVEEKLLAPLALIVGDRLSLLTENLHLSASVHEQAKEAYSLPDTQALYVLRIWVDQKEQKMSDLLDALDRTGLKEVVSWAKAGRLEEFLHMQQKGRELRQAKWVSRFSTSVTPAHSASLFMEHQGDNVSKDAGRSGIPLSQEALQQHDAITSNITIDGPVGRYVPLSMTSLPLTGTLSDMDTASVD